MSRSSHGQQREPCSTVAPRPCGLLVHVTGVVQGVGFRPFVYSLATRYGLTGWVRNTSGGVEARVDGAEESLSAFLASLDAEAPPLARIERIESTPLAPDGYDAFRILESASVPGTYQPVPPDVATCPACMAEVRDPADRRYRYPFTNCTNCGPRFTIIAGLPYDRPSTTMAGFALCPDCAAEYANPSDRRYHAQPIACPVCGPKVWLEQATGNQQGGPQGDDAIQAVRRLLASGGIVAIKGLGGFHLACDAEDERAVAELRRRKNREAKPLALMLPTLEEVERHCVVSPDERQLLASANAPIVLLRRRPDSTIARGVAPDTAELGVMLPYTPLHHLLLEPGQDAARALVMTSGNLSEEPVVTANDEARLRLGTIADAFLMHDRPIRTRCDDSVARVLGGRPYFLRRSRGYAPYPVGLPARWPSVLAVGAELKNVFALTRDGSAFLSHHIGDMENLETLEAFHDGVGHLEGLFRVTPRAVAHDLHPDYLATRYAVERALRDAIPAEAVQHHHAHVAACMVDNGLPVGSTVIGVAFDGTGLGTDGAIWGGEVLLAGYARFERCLHLAYVPLPGGNLAVRQPWRMALSWLRAAGIDWTFDLPSVAAAPSSEALGVLARQLDLGLNSPSTSSVGRLFDAASSIAGLRHHARFEAQAAMALEAVLAPDDTGAYDVDVGPTTIDPRPLIRSLAADVVAGVGVDRLAARFHNGLASAVLRACQQVASRSGVRDVALSGGVWQNVSLLQRTVAALEQDGFRVLVHRQVPPNDGGLALGQAAVAGARLDGR
jgi:hydrogenase maturation protein HypF